MVHSTEYKRGGQRSWRKSPPGRGPSFVVEDEDPLRLAVVKGLQKRGFAVLEACDGPAALDLIRSDANEIDAALLDVMLRGMSSREIFEETRRLRPCVNVILTSAYSEETVEASFGGLRIERFIRKPFHLADRPILSACLRTLYHDKFGVLLLGVD